MTCGMRNQKDLRCKYMAINSFYASSPIRLMGMSSGLDTDAIIKQMMMLHQMKIDSQMRSRTLLEWRQQSLTDIKTELTDFKRSYLTVLGQNAMRVANIYNSTIATVSGKNKEAVTVATTTGASAGVIKIGEIMSLAKNTSISTIGDASRYGDGFKLSDKLGDIRVATNDVKFDENNEATVEVEMTRMKNDSGVLTPVTLKENITLTKGMSAFDLRETLRDTFQGEFTGKGIDSSLVDFTEDMDIKVNGRELTLTTTDDAVKLLDKLNGLDAYKDIAFDSSSKLSITVNGKALEINSGWDETAISNALKSVGVNYNSAGKAYANINGYEVSLSAGDDDADGLVKKINDAGTYASKQGQLGFDQNGLKNIRINGVSITLNKDMTIDDMLKKINSSNAGVTMSYDRMADKFTIESNKQGASDLNVWGMGAFGITDGTYNNGSKAKVMINDKWEEYETNTFEIRGAKITLNYTTSSATYNASEDDITVTFKRDSTEAVEKIKTFVDSYNVIINKLENMLRETKNSSERKYTPLTDEEKSLMSEKQVEDWEAIARKGLLRNDAGIQSLINSLRGALFETVTDAGLSPTQIGLSTGRWDSGTGGQIIIDEDRLRAALESDPEKVMNVFMGGAESSQSAGRGLLWRMEDLMNGYMNGSQDSTLNNLENSIRKSNEQMEKLQLKMYEEEEKLYRKFSAMETALSKIQSQTDWFSAMLDATKK